MLTKRLLFTLITNLCSNIKDYGVHILKFKNKKHIIIFYLIKSYSLSVCFVTFIELIKYVTIL